MLFAHDLVRAVRDEFQPAQAVLHALSSIVREDTSRDIAPITNTGMSDTTRKSAVSQRFDGELSQKNEPIFFTGTPQHCAVHAFAFTRVTQTPRAVFKRAAGDAADGNKKPAARPYAFRIRSGWSKDIRWASAASAF
jgi:hypothetical protein